MNTVPENSAAPHQESPSPISPTERPKLEAALKFIHENFHRSPELREISAVAGLSPFHFHRRFTKCFSITPKRLVAKLQVEEAKRLIQQGMPLAQVSKQLGYAHQSHLTLRFRQLTGTTPAKWRSEIGSFRS